MGWDGFSRYRIVANLVLHSSGHATSWRTVYNYNLQGDVLDNGASDWSVPVRFWLFLFDVHSLNRRDSPLLTRSKTSKRSNFRPQGSGSPQNADP